MSYRASRKREPEINLAELLWALEDDVIERRRAKSEPPMRACRSAAPKFLELHMEFSLESSLSSSAEVTWSEEASHSKKSKQTKRRKIRQDLVKSDEATEKAKQPITVIVEEEAPSIYMTPPKSPDHEVCCTPAEAKQRLMETVNEYRSQTSNNDAITLISQLAQMAFCYNNKERPGGSDYDNMHQLVYFYTEAPQIRDPSNAADEPLWFLPQKLYLMRRQVRQRLYGAVSLLRSQQVCSKPTLPEEYRSDPMMMSIVEEAAALGKNCHTLALLLEDLHSIPDL